MESTSVPIQFPLPSRLERQVSDQDSWHHELFRRGVTRFCTCRKNCMYMQNRSEGCENGGDGGQRYIDYCNIQSLSMA